MAETDEKSDYKPVKWGRPKKYTSRKDMQGDIDAYFKECEDESEARTIMGLALALDMTRETLCQYEKDGEFSDIVKKAKLIVANEVEKRMLAGHGNQAGNIFWLKNHGGMKDKVEVDNTHTIKSIKVAFDGDSDPDS